MLVCWQSGVREVVRSYQLERHSAHRRLEAEVSNIEGSGQLRKTVTTLGPKTPEQRVTTPPGDRSQKMSLDPFLEKCMFGGLGPLSQQIAVLPSDVGREHV